MQSALMIICTATILCACLLIYFSAKTNERLIHNLTVDLKVHFSEILVATKVQLHAEHILMNRIQDEKVTDALAVLEQARIAALDLIQEARKVAEIKLQAEKIHA